MSSLPHDSPARNIPSWGVGLIAERLALLAEHDAATRRMAAAREACDREAIEQADSDHLTIYGACAIHRAAVVNDSLAALRMMCEDDPGMVAQYLAPIVEHIARGLVRPVAESVARLEAA